jgi:class 3 adenylate cyclase
MSKKQQVERRLAAVVSMDVAGYSTQMAADELGTLEVLKGHRALLEKLIATHQGRLVGTAGDSLLIEFSSAIRAVEFASAAQLALAKSNKSLPAERRLLFRTGINLGDVIVDGTDILGDGVNIAARLQTLAEVGGICISQSIYEQVAGKTPLGFEFVGERAVKNIAEPVHVYRVVIDGPHGRVAAPVRSPADEVGATKEPEGTAATKRNVDPSVSPRSRLVLCLICVFFGVLGIHRLYLGRPGTALLMFFTSGGLVVWWLVDIFAAATGSLNDSEGRPVSNWI